jgi:DNA-binding Xre family transcriptional regulator
LILTLLTAEKYNETVDVVVQIVIRWRLREVMARYDIKSIDLARELELSANAISHMRKGNDMPRIDGSTLDRLCNALNNLAEERDVEITPADLIEYSREELVAREVLSRERAKSVGNAAGRRR